MLKKIKNFIYKKLARLYFKIKKNAEETQYNRNYNSENFLKMLIQIQSFDKLIQIQSFDNKSNEKRFIYLNYNSHNLLKFLNLGDFIQTIATYSAVKSFMGEGIEEIEFFDRDSLSFYQGKGGICIMQGFFCNTNTDYFLPISNKILSVFVGTHFTAQAQDFLKHIVFRSSYFSDKEIGCRDKFTLEFCQKLGIKS